MKVGTNQASYLSTSLSIGERSDMDLSIACWKKHWESEFGQSSICSAIYHEKPSYLEGELLQKNMVENQAFRQVMLLQNDSKIEITTEPQTNRIASPFFVEQLNSKAIINSFNSDGVRGDVSLKIQRVGVNKANLFATSEKKELMNRLKTHYSPFKVTVFYFNEQVKIWVRDGLLTRKNHKLLEMQISEWSKRNHLRCTLLMVNGTTIFRKGI